jgi:hypothetical protein
MPKATGVLQCAALALSLWQAPVGAQSSSSAFPPDIWQQAVRVAPAEELSDSARLTRLQDQLIRTAETSYRARVVPALPGFAQALRDVVSRTGRPWTGLPPVVMVVPDNGRGFECGASEHGCLGRYIGAELSAPGQSGVVSSMSSIILIAESAKRRPDVWMHELTHALLTQHGMMAESARHDRRFFSEDSFVMVGVGLP